MKKPVIVAALAAASLAYAASAPAFTPVVTAPYAFSWNVVAAINKYFCTRCGGSSTSGSGGAGANSDIASQYPGLSTAEAYRQMR